MSLTLGARWEAVQMWDLWARLHGCLESVPAQEEARERVVRCQGGRQAGIPEWCSAGHLRPGILTSTLPGLHSYYCWSLRCFDFNFFSWLRIFLMCFIISFRIVDTWMLSLFCSLQSPQVCISLVSMFCERGMQIFLPLDRKPQQGSCTRPWH